MLSASSLGDLGCAPFPETCSQAQATAHSRSTLPPLQRLTRAGSTRSKRKTLQVDIQRKRPLHGRRPSSEILDRLDGLHLVLQRELGLVLGGDDVGHLEAGLLLYGVQARPDALFGLVLELVDVLCRRVKVLFALLLPVPPLFCECWCVLLLDLCVVRAEIGCEVRVEDVQADDKGEGRREHADREGAVAGEDASGQRGDTDIKKAGGERLGVGDERLDFALDRALDRDPAVDERADRGACVGGKVRDGATGGADLTLELGLNRNDFDFGIWLRIDRELMSTMRGEVGKGKARCSKGCVCMCVVDTEA